MGRADEQRNNMKLWKRIAIISMCATAVLAVVAVMAVMGNHTNYAVLYSGLSDDEAGAVYAALQELGMEVKTAPDKTIMVPEDKVNETLIALGAKGRPEVVIEETDGTVYLNNAMSFGATDDEKARIYQFQLEEMLAQTIGQISNVNISEVLLFPVENGDEGSIAFSSASVGVEPKQGVELTKDDLEQIKEIVAGAVPNFSKESVSVVDKSKLEP